MGITHNNEFCSKLCPETWVMDSGHLETKGDADWMLKQDEKIEAQEQITEVTDAAGNVSKVKQAKKKMSKKEEKQMMKKIKSKLRQLTCPTPTTTTRIPTTQRMT